MDIINREEPDLVVVAGDLSVEGYREQFEEAGEYIGMLACPRKMVMAGDHDCRNAGHVHLEEIFGPCRRKVPASREGAAGHPGRGAGTGMQGLCPRRWRIDRALSAPSTA